MIEPVRFEQADPQHVQVTWKDRSRVTYLAQDLRRACPCATCVDELTGAPLLDPQTVPEDLAIVDADVVGRYAFRFSFSDGHSTGLYTFDRLHAMGAAGKD